MVKPYKKIKRQSKSSEEEDNAEDDEDIRLCVYCQENNYHQEMTDELSVVHTRTGSMKVARVRWMRILISSNTTIVFKRFN